MALMVDERIKSEVKFHDQKYSNSNDGPRHYTVHPTWTIFKKIIEKLGDIRGKKILEVGCGTGWITAELASIGGYVDAIDISSEAIKKAISFLKTHDLLDRCNFSIMKAEGLKYEKDSFDIIVGFAVLHHLNLSKSMPEFYRVLKPGGRAYFAEPLGYNAFINLYRHFTPIYRTPDEHPLLFEDLFVYEKKFLSIKHEEYYLLALISFLLVYIPFLKKHFNFFSKKLIKTDNFLLKKFPNIGRYAWYTIVEYTK